MSAKKSASTAGEIVITRTFAVPRELVFRAWTEPAQLAQWWGPQGFTNPVCEWDARPGGKIYDVMRAPDGTDYPMGGVFQEVVAPERLVFTTGALDEKGHLLFEFSHTLTFAETNGRTTLTLRSRVTMTTPGAEKYIGGFEAGMTQSWERLAELITPAADREIVLSRVFDAPRALVWQAMTEPKHVVQWWGPRGFTDTLVKMDFRVGGVWEHIMHGPDGANYPNKSVFKEIVPLERVVYAHGGRREHGPGAAFVASWNFETVESTKTRLTLRMVFPTAKDRDFVIKEFGAIEGGKQTLQKLADFLPTMAAASPDFTLTRVFDAPRDLVWKVWNDPEHLQRWFTPQGSTMQTRAMDFRLGGVYHFCVRSPDGHEMWDKWTFVEIAPPERLVVIISFSDAKGGVTRHPLSATWPLETLATTTFTERDGKTTITLRWAAHHATAEERQTFDSSHDSMTQGWGGMMAQLETYLAGLNG